MQVVKEKENTLCSILQVNSCSGYSSSCATCLGQLIKDRDSVQCINCGTRPNDDRYHVILTVAEYTTGQFQVLLLGKCLDHLLGIPPLKLHNHLLQHDLSDRDIVEGLSRMLVGQCILLTLSSNSTTVASTGDKFIATGVQIVGDGCQTILSYPPFSAYLKSQCTDDKDEGPVTPNPSLSFLSESFSSAITPMKIESPSPATLLQQASSLAPTFQVSSPNLSPRDRNLHQQNFTTPELFSDCSSFELPPPTTPASRYRTLSNPAVTPDLF